MSTKVKQGQYLFPVRDAADNDKVTLIPVTKDFYITANREISRKRKQLQRNGECCCPKKYLWKCDGDCERCRWHITVEQPLCLDAPSSEDENIFLMDTIADDAPLPEDIIEDKALLAALFHELENLDDHSRKLCEIMPNMSEREAAAALGIPRNTLTYRWKKLKDTLADKLKDYR